MKRIMSIRESNMSISGSTTATAAIGLLGVAGVGVMGYLLGTKTAQVANSQRRLNQSSRHSEDVSVKDKKAIVDVRIVSIRPLLPPACLLEEIPLTTTTSKTVNYGREAIANVIRGTDDRLVVVVGPCSIHDTEAALEYAQKLKKIHDEMKDDLIIIMRVYFEKPRTTVGWKGLINDPDLDGSFNINKGLRLARQLLSDINSLGLPVGCEFLDTMSPQFTTDLVSWGAIGARTSECQLHRELTSGLSMPIGFKNGTGGSLQLAADAVVSAKHPHCFLSVSTQGLAAIVTTTGNDTCHVILRGGSTGPNYEQEHIDSLSSMLKKANVHDRVMVDCSHGNSRKDFRNQPIVCDDIAKQIASGDLRLMGAMIESNLVEGAQKLIPGQPLEYGKSITDGCISWDTTVDVLNRLAEAVRSRREVVNAK